MRKQTRKWTQRDGTKIRICDMTTRHIENSIQLLDRWAQAELVRRLDLADAICNFVTADIASDMASDRADELAHHGSPKDFLPDIYDNLKDELNRREQETERDIK